ncbi:hypothetical protein OE88DRAFT_1728500 [Heliocybe sulcata]|uniref:Uncharacterized protein n=1 Tax=Heliocybe sulcata TaxID=5364 RepID=A0A5C3MPS8_9AGAM|nr:hypothetical protein OE88DRAFT_1728500 [Heliocybe sulcata]
MTMLRSTLLAPNPDLDFFRGRPRPPSSTTPPRRPRAPTIRLENATPVATEAIFQGDTSFNGSIMSVPSPLAPRHENEAPRRRLIPKKSRLSLLSGSMKPRNRGDSRSDAAQQGSASACGDGFEIYVDPIEDPDLGDIVMVKKKKSRAGLNSISWEPAMLEDVTNTAEVAHGRKENGEKDKWWNLGRGSRDSKGKPNAKGIENVKPRSKTPEPARPLTSTSTEARVRSHSLDVGILLNSRTETHIAGSISGLPSPHIHRAPPLHGSCPPDAPTLTFMAPQDEVAAPKSGSIAIRAMRSMRSMARVGSWAQLKNPEKDESVGTKPRSMTRKSLGSIGSWAGLKNSENDESVGTRPPARKSLGSLGGWAGPKNLEKDEPVSIRPQSRKSLGNLAGWAGLTNVENDESAGTRPRSRKSLGSLGGWAGLTNVEKDESISTRPRSRKSVSSLGGWAQPKGADREDPASTKTESTEEKGIDTKPERKKRKKKAKAKAQKAEKTEAKEETQRPVKTSNSSWEMGVSSAAPGTVPTLEKKQSILGLGWQATKRLGMARSNSSSVSIVADQGPSRPSVRSSLDLSTIARIRSASTMSNGSSLRPQSTSSSRAGKSSSGSVSSVRWDEPALETVKEMAKKERTIKRQASTIFKEQVRKISGRSDKESRKSSASRKRTPARELFQETLPEAHEVREDPPSKPTALKKRVLTLEGATEEGHYDAHESSETPVKVARPRHARPMSEQLPGHMKRSRPTAVCEDSDGYISALDAATNDLASLVDRLDLEATPKSINASSLKQKASWSALPRWKGPREDDSSVKKQARASDQSKEHQSRHNVSSTGSIRLGPYAQSRGRSSIPVATHHHGVAKQIAPWPISPTRSRERGQAVAENENVLATVTVRRTHKRKQWEIPAPAPNPPVFQPLRPSRPRVTTRVAAASEDDDSSPEMARRLLAREESVHISGLALGSSPSQPSSAETCNDDKDGWPTPVFRRPSTHQLAEHLRDSILIPREARRGLGLTGTMGASTFTADENIDPDDPDSDIPDELQAILAGQSDSDGDTISFRVNVSEDLPPSPGSPPTSPLPEPSPDVSLDDRQKVPVFRALLNDEHGNEIDIDEDCLPSPSEDDTQQSFDFTGELRMLRESGGCDQASFIEELENAFRTSARFDLQYGFDGSDDFTDAAVSSATEAVSQRTVEDEVVEESAIASSYAGSSAPSDDWLTRKPPVTAINEVPGTKYDDPESMRSRPSYGKLNREFKFGGPPSAEFPSIPRPFAAEEKPLTLSDIIPPASLARALSSGSRAERDSSVLKAIYTDSEFSHAQSPPFRLRSGSSDSGSKQRARDEALCKLTGVHSNQPSAVSVRRLESFDEVRRRFEYNSNRPTFYPPPQATYRRGDAPEISRFSVTSASSRGVDGDSGFKDDSDQWLHGRTKFDDASSMSLSVDDTFSFLKHEPQHIRRRLDSNASSFYFRAARNSQVLEQRRRRPESVISVASAGPAVTIYSRGPTGYNRRSLGTCTSGSSVVEDYAMYGANSARASWASHQYNPSVDSFSSDFSPARLGRPGLGDKMFGSGDDYCMRLPAYPPASGGSKDGERRSSYDYSTSDHDRRSSMQNSLFDKSGYGTSISSESLFGRRFSHPLGRSLPPDEHFRPVSLYSQRSIHSLGKEDDTMISMLGGGRVRRRSMGSVVEASPCVVFSKRKQRELDHHHPVLPIHPVEWEVSQRVLVASPSSSHFDNQMGEAIPGSPVRRSLEENPLTVEGAERATGSWVSPSGSAPGSRPRSGTVGSSDAGTPSLSSDGSSQSGGSPSSIDVSHLDALLSDATEPTPDVRARARCAGHRRLSQARVSRHSMYSVYETIEEEFSSGSDPSSSGAPNSFPSDSVLVVDQDVETAELDAEGGTVILRRYYTLQEEAEETVEESKRVWIDTPFSLFALQSFEPPRHGEGMKAFLEHSRVSHGPLPSELRARRIRSRANSRPSPYPRSDVSLSPDQIVISRESVRPSVLRDGSGRSNAAASPGAGATKVADRSRGEQLRARRRGDKENVFGTDDFVISAPQGLRINRPRPRGRPSGPRLV